MTALDIFVILLLGGAALIGFVRGFTHEVLSLIAWVVGIAALKLFHTPLQERLVDAVGTEAGASVVAFGATLFFLLANLATDMLYGPNADRPEWMTDSRTYPLLNATGRAVVDWVETRRHPGVKL